MENWILPALLGLGLAASSGLKTFLPLLVLAAASRLHAFGTDLAGPFAWLASTPALVALGLATVVELAADKIPLVDHGLSLVGTVTKPAAGALAAAAAFSHLDPTTAAIAGLIIGAPTALGVHAAQSTARVASTATTGGLANPLFSLAEDVMAFFGALLSLAAPLIVPILLLIAGLGIWRIARELKRRAPAFAGRRSG